MATNDFSKEERVAFEDILEGFQDGLVLSKQVATFRRDKTSMERSDETIWRPQPYIAQTFTGTDMTSNYQGFTQLSVPATLGYNSAAPWIMSATELNDALQEGRLGVAARQKMASDVNISLMNVAALQGTIFVKRTAAASGFDDVAAAEALMNEQGIGMEDRNIFLSTRDYNSMASDLAGRETLQKGKTLSAYERAYVGMIAGFETFKLDYANRLTAASTADTMSTLDAAGNYHTPVATRVATTGEKSNVDNRYQQITISSTTNVEAGDAFTIAGVYAVHHITKQTTGQLKTFRVISIDSATAMTISPPIISNQGGTDAEAQYQNVTIATGDKSGTAAVTYLNTVANYVNPFWHRDAIEILPGFYSIPEGAGAAIMRGSTDQGLEVTFQKFYDIDTMVTKFRLDTRWGVCMKQPEMSGIMMFSQT